MDCPKCNLRYNTATRRPKVHECGHSLCESCCNKLLLCHTCQKVFDKTKSNINYSLMQMLSQKKQAKDIDKLVKVCFVGESTVGKTSLINRLKGDQYREHTITTIGYDFAFQDRVIEGLNVRFQLWDSAGQERYRAISPLHYKNSDLVVIVYDMSKNGKYNNVEHWLDEANHHCPESVIKILLGNKVDLLEQPNTKPNNPLDHTAWKTIASEKINNYEVSCRTNQGIEDFWTILENNVKTILKRVVSKHNPFKDANSLEAFTPQQKQRSSLRNSPKKTPKHSRCQC